MFGCLKWYHLHKWGPWLNQKQSVIEKQTTQLSTGKTFSTGNYIIITQDRTCARCGFVQHHKRKL